jgi:hypothetical protein
MEFTKASVAALTLPASKTDHFEWDDVTPGFGVRLREPDKKVWCAQLALAFHAVKHADDQQSAHQLQQKAKLVACVLDLKRRIQPGSMADLNRIRDGISK